MIVNYSTKDVCISRIFFESRQDREEFCCMDRSFDGLIYIGLIYMRGRYTEILYHRISYSVMDGAYDRCEFFARKCTIKDFSNILSRMRERVSSSICSNYFVIALGQKNLYRSKSSSILDASKRAVISRSKIR